MEPFKKFGTAGVNFKSSKNVVKITEGRTVP